MDDLVIRVDIRAGWHKDARRADMAEEPYEGIGKSGRACDCGRPGNCGIVTGIVFEAAIVVIEEEELIFGESQNPERIESLGATDGGDGFALFRCAVSGVAERGDASGHLDAGLDSGKEQKSGTEDYVVIVWGDEEPTLPVALPVGEYTGWICGRESNSIREMFESAHRKIRCLR